LNGALTQRGEPQKAGLPLFFSGLPYSGGKSDFGFNRLLSKQAFKAIYLRSKSSIAVVSPRDSTTSHDTTFSKNPDTGGIGSADENNLARSVFCGP
jgi:hypothetical protein